MGKQFESLRIGCNFGCVQPFSYLLFKCCFLRSRLWFRAIEQISGCLPLLNTVRHNPGITCRCYHGYVDTLFQGFQAGPAAGSLLPCTVQNIIHQLFVCKIIFLPEDTCCNFNQITLQFAFIPLCKCIGQLFICKAACVFKEQISFCNQLHICIFDPIVYHLNVVAGAVRTHVGTAWLALCFCRDCFQDGGNMAVCLFVPSRHDRGAKTGSLLSSGNASSKIKDSFFTQVFLPSSCVFKERVPAIQNHISLIKKRK